MDDFLAASLSFPTVIFTVLMLIALAYWLFGIIGAIGLEALDFHHDAGGAHGHGGDAAGHGDVDHGHSDHGDHGDADAHHGHSAEGLGLLPTLLWVLKL